MKDQFQYGWEEISYCWDSHCSTSLFSYSTWSFLRANSVFIYTNIAWKLQGCNGKNEQMLIKNFFGSHWNIIRSWNIIRHLFKTKPKNPQHPPQPPPPPQEKKQTKKTTTKTQPIRLRIERSNLWNSYQHCLVLGNGYFQLQITVLNPVHAYSYCKLSSSLVSWKWPTPRQVVKHHQNYVVLISARSKKERVRKLNSDHEGQCWWTGWENFPGVPCTQGEDKKRRSAFKAVIVTLPTNTRPKKRQK